MTLTTAGKNQSINDKQNILVLGAGVYQVPLIKRVKSMGYKAIVVTPDGDYPGINHADVIVNCDTRNKEGVLQAAKNWNVVAALTAGTDVAVPTIGYLVDNMGLCGTGYQQAVCSTNKSIMKKCLIDHAIPTADYKLAYSFEELKEVATSMGFPVMIKALDSSGSRGVTKVSYFSQIYDAYKAAKTVSSSCAVLVEEYLNGYEIGAQAVIVGDQVQAIYFHNDQTTSPPISVPVGHSMPTILHKEIQKAVKLVIHDTVKAIGLTDTVANFDLMIVDNSPYVIEVGARIGATCIPENISYYTSLDIYKLLIDLSLGRAIEIPTSPYKLPNASHLILSEASGKVVQIIIPPETRNHPNLLELNLDIEIGDYVKKFQVGSDRVGHLLVMSDTSSNAENLARKLSKSIKIILEEE